MSSRPRPAVLGDSGRVPAMSHTGNSGESSPASRGRRSRPPHAQEDTAEAAGERLRELSIGEGDDSEHNRMIRSQYRELISTVQRKEAAGGAPGLRRLWGPGWRPGGRGAEGRSWACGLPGAEGALLELRAPRAADALGLCFDRNWTPRKDWIAKAWIGWKGPYG